MHTYGWFVVSVDLQSFILDVFKLDRFNNNANSVDITVYSLYRLDSSGYDSKTSLNFYRGYYVVIYYSLYRPIFTSQIHKSNLLLTQP